MDLVKLKAELIEDEGRKVRPYKDTKGIWTGGIGHNLEAHRASWLDTTAWLQAGIPDRVIDEWYDEDSQTAKLICQRVFPIFEALSDNRQRALVNMAFVLGNELYDWHHLRDAIAAKDWPQAAKSITDSYFAHQAPDRCSRLAARMVN